MPKQIFLTGASGNMGNAALEHLLSSHQDIKVRILVLPSELRHRRIRRWQADARVEVLAGDLRNYEDVLAGVTGARYVLHVGGMVSPACDRFPELTRQVNVGGAANIVRAIQQQPEPDAVRLVYIGTVAQTGSRNAPIHWGRTGDPIKISKYDHYAVTKTQAEAIVAESGLRYWVSLRQSGMAHPDMWKIFDPIMFHNPINGVFEWSTVKDSGRLMAAVCGDEVPERFWRSFYNIGGGSSCRVDNHEFMRMTFEAMSGDYRKVLDPHWIATRNFHGQWFADSDALERLVPYRSQSLADFMHGYRRAIPWYVKATARFLPGAIRKRIAGLAHAEGGSMAWIENDDTEHINAFFGSRADWERIPRSWDRFELASAPTRPTLLDHGYDEQLAPDRWDGAVLQQAAAFRGGACLSDAGGGPYRPVRWRCARRHEFDMSPNLFLRGGHWCPQCMVDPSTYDEVARHSPYFRQVWPD